MITLLIQAFIVLCIVGVILWGVSKVPGVPDVVKTVVYVIVAVVLLVWLYNWVSGHGLSMR